MHVGIVGGHLHDARTASSGLMVWEGSVLETHGVPRKSHSARIVTEKRRSTLVSPIGRIEGGRDLGSGGREVSDVADEWNNIATNSGRGGSSRFLRVGGNGELMNQLLFAGVVSSNVVGLQELHDALVHFGGEFGHR